MCAEREHDIVAGYAIKAVFRQIARSGRGKQQRTRCGKSLFEHAYKPPRRSSPET